MNNNDKTIFEDNDATLLEEIAVTDRFIRINQDIRTFRDYTVIRQFTTSGSEADIYLVEKVFNATSENNFILKLYRNGISPKEEIINKIKKLSNEFYDSFVKIYESGLDNETNRWYEIQEYIKFSSLKELTDPEPHLKIIIAKISEGLKILHNNRILHLDLKPANILIRSIEPLVPVFTDFGISSILDQEMTRKMTTIKGTPLYWSPESFTGVVGEEADYWSLGIIILEILTGQHPFSRMEIQVVMFTLSTKGVDIPEDLPDDYKIILRGLLTRNPRKRWGYNEVSRWLNGEKNLKVFYFEDRTNKAGYQFPYEFKSEYYDSLNNLLNKIVSDEKSWEEGRLHFNKGYIDRWLEKNQDFSKAIEAENFREKNVNPDLGFIKFIYKFNPTLPFVLNGKYITLQNLYLYTVKSIKRQESETEKKILKDLQDNSLLNYYKEYQKLTNKEPDELFTFLDLLNKNKLNSEIQKIYKCLNIIFEPLKFSVFKYYDLNSLIIFTLSYLDVILSKELLLELISTYVIPHDYIKSLETGTLTKYGDALKDIKYLYDNKYLIEKRELTKLYNNNILPAELKNHLFNGNVSLYILSSGNIKRLMNSKMLINKEELEYITENYVLPDYVKENLNSSSNEINMDIISNLMEIKELKLLIEKKEVKYLESCILPHELIDNLKKGTLQLYQETARNIRHLQDKNLLIKPVDLEMLSRKYIIPTYLKESLKNIDFIEYLEAIKNLRYLQDNDLLIEKTKMNSLPNGQIRKIMTGSLSEYIISVNEINNIQENLEIKRREKLRIFLIVGIVVFFLLLIIMMARFY